MQQVCCDSHAFLMWLDVPASKTQLLHTCAFAANFHWLIHSRCLIDELAVSGQLQHAANLLKFRHFTIYNVHFAMCNFPMYTNSIYKSVSRYLILSISRGTCPSLARIIVYTYFRITVELEQCNGIGERDLR